MRLLRSNSWWFKFLESAGVFWIDIFLLFNRFYCGLLLFTRMLITIWVRYVLRSFSFMCLRTFTEEFCCFCVIMLCAVLFRIMLLLSSYSCFKLNVVLIYQIQVQILWSWCLTSSFTEVLSILSLFRKVFFFGRWIVMISAFALFWILPQKSVNMLTVRRRDLINGRNLLFLFS